MITPRSPSGLGELVSMTAAARLITLNVPITLVFIKRVNSLVCVAFPSGVTRGTVAMNPAVLTLMSMVPKRSPRGSDRGLDLFGVGDVGAEADRSPAEFGSDLLCEFSTTTDQRDVRSAFDEVARDSQAETRSRPGQQNGFSLNVHDA
jgi:hypothetical protein